MILEIKRFSFSILQRGHVHMYNSVLNVTSEVELVRKQKFHLSDAAVPQSSTSVTKTDGSVSLQPGVLSF